MGVKHLQSLSNRVVWRPATGSSVQEQPAPMGSDNMTVEHELHALGLSNNVTHVHQELPASHGSDSVTIRPRLSASDGIDDVTVHPWLSASEGIDNVTVHSLLSAPEGIDIVTVHQQLSNGSDSVTDDLQLPAPESIDNRLVQELHASQGNDQVTSLMSDNDYTNHNDVIEWQVNALTTAMNRLQLSSRKLVRQSQNGSFVQELSLPSGSDDVTSLVSNHDYTNNNHVVEWQVNALTMDIKHFHINENSTVILSPGENHPFQHNRTYGKHKRSVYFDGNLEPPAKKRKIMVRDIDDNRNDVNSNPNIGILTSGENYPVGQSRKRKISLYFDDDLQPPNKKRKIMVRGIDDNRNVVDDDNPTVSLVHPGENKTIVQFETPVPRGSERMISDITNHYKNLSAKNKLVFALKNREILEKFKDVDVNRDERKIHDENHIGNIENINN